MHKPCGHQTEGIQTLVGWNWGGGGWGTEGCFNAASPVHRRTGGRGSYNINLPHTRCQRTLTNVLFCSLLLVGGGVWRLLTQTHTLTRSSSVRRWIYIKPPTDGERGHVYPFTDCVGRCSRRLVRGVCDTKNVRSALPGMSLQ